MKEIIFKLKCKYYWEKISFENKMKYCLWNFKHGAKNSVWESSFSMYLTFKIWLVKVNVKKLKKKKEWKRYSNLKLWCVQLNLFLSAKVKQRPGMCLFSFSFFPKNVEKVEWSVRSTGLLL